MQKYLFWQVLLNFVLTVSFLQLEDFFVKVEGILIAKCFFKQKTGQYYKLYQTFLMENLDLVKKIHRCLSSTRNLYVGHIPPYDFVRLPSAKIKCFIFLQMKLLLNIKV